MRAKDWIGKSLIIFIIALLVSGVSIQIYIEYGIRFVFLFLLMSFGALIIYRFFRKKLIKLASGLLLKIENIVAEIADIVYIYCILFLLKYNVLVSGLLRFFILKNIEYRQHQNCVLLLGMKSTLEESYSRTDHIRTLVSGTYIDLLKGQVTIARARQYLVLNLEMNHSYENKSITYWVIFLIAKLLKHQIHKSAFLGVLIKKEIDINNKEAEEKNNADAAVTDVLDRISGICGCILPIHPLWVVRSLNRSGAGGGSVQLPDYVVIKTGQAPNKLMRTGINFPDFIYKKARKIRNRGLVHSNVDYREFDSFFYAEDLRFCMNDINNVFFKALQGHGEPKIFVDTICISFTPDKFSKRLNDIIHQCGKPSGISLKADTKQTNFPEELSSLASKTEHQYTPQGIRAQYRKYGIFSMIISLSAIVASENIHQNINNMYQSAKQTAEMLENREVREGIKPDITQIYEFLAALQPVYDEMNIVGIDRYGNTRKIFNSLNKDYVNQYEKSVSMRVAEYINTSLVIIKDTKHLTSAKKLLEFLKAIVVVQNKIISGQEIEPSFYDWLNNTYSNLPSTKDALPYRDNDLFAKLYVKYLIVLKNANNLKETSLTSKQYLMSLMDYMRPVPSWILNTSSGAGMRFGFSDMSNEDAVYSVEGVRAFKNWWIGIEPILVSMERFNTVKLEYYRNYVGKCYAFLKNRIERRTRLFLGQESSGNEPMELSGIIQGDELVSDLFLQEIGNTLRELKLLGIGMAYSEPAWVKIVKKISLLAISPHKPSGQNLNILNQSISYINALNDSIVNMAASDGRFAHGEELIKTYASYVDSLKVLQTIASEQKKSLKFAQSVMGEIGATSVESNNALHNNYTSQKELQHSFGLGDIHESTVWNYLSGKTRLIWRRILHSAVVHIESEWQDVLQEIDQIQLTKHADAYNIEIAKIDLISGFMKKYLDSLLVYETSGRVIRKSLYGENVPLSSVFLKYLEKFMKNTLRENHQFDLMYRTIPIDITRDSVMKVDSIKMTLACNKQKETVRNNNYYHDGVINYDSKNCNEISLYTKINGREYLTRTEGLINIGRFLLNCMKRACEARIPSLAEKLNNRQQVYVVNTGIKIERNAVLANIIEYLGSSIPVTIREKL